MDQEPTADEHPERETGAERRPAPEPGAASSPRLLPRRVSPGATPPGIFLGDESLARRRPAAAPDVGGDQVTSQSAADAAGGPAPSVALLSLTALALLPVTALALLPFWLVLQRVSDVPYLAIFAGYLMVGAALLFRSTQRLLLATFFDAREPTPRELEILEPAWHNVLDQAGIDRDRFVLAVSDVPYVDAIASGGHVVAVSHLALRVLPADELEAALAHELGHHLGVHSAGRLAALWLETPVLLFARLGVGLELAAYGLALLFAWQEDFGPALGAALAGLAVRVASQLVPTAIGLTGVLHQLHNRLGRVSIYHADRVAVDLGYGDALVELLERTVELRLEGDDRRGEHLLGRHALVAKRIERIEARLAAAGG